MNKKGFIRPLLLLILLVVLGLTIFLVLSRTRLFNRASTGSALDPKKIKVNVALVIYNPTVTSVGNLKIIDFYRWNDPVQMSNTVVSDLEKSSHDTIDLNIVKTITQDKFLPHLAGGNVWRYTASQYSSAYARKQFTYYPADWVTILNENSLIDPINAGEIDEVWLWGPPEGGYYEATMVGPSGFSTNGPPFTTNLLNRNVVFMNLNYERNVSEALESIAHRSEGMIEHRYGQKNTWGSNAKIYNDWDAFNALEMYLPGQGGIGNPHNAFNAELGTDYNRISTRMAATSADDWYNFPNMTGATTMKNCTAWGDCQLSSENARRYLNWYFDHMPHVSGIKEQYLNNWWRYIFDPNQRALYYSRFENQILDKQHSYICLSHLDSTCTISADTYTVRQMTEKMIKVHVSKSSTSSAIVNFTSPYEFSSGDFLSYALYVDEDTQNSVDGYPIVKLKTDENNYYMYTRTGQMHYSHPNWDVFEIYFNNRNSSFVMEQSVVGKPGKINQLELINNFNSLENYDLYFARPTFWTVLPDTQPPVVSFDASTSFVLTDPKVLNVSSTDNFGLDRIELYVDNTLVDYDSFAPFTFLLDPANIPVGLHTLKVQAVDFLGNTSSKTVTFTVPKAVEADFSMDKSTGQPPLTVKFTNLSNPNNLAGVKYSWDFGDGQTSVEESPTHVFAFPPDKLLTEYDYQVTLTAISTSNVTTQKSATVHLASVATGILFTPTIKVKPIEGKAPLKSSFVCKLPPGSNPLNLIIGCRWNFGDNSKEVITEPGQTIFHTFKLPTGQTSYKFKIKMTGFNYAKPEETAVLKQTVTVKK